MTYYCKKCENIVGKWQVSTKNYNGLYYCTLIESKNINSIFFIECDNCNKFIGIKCYNVCENCFGKYPIIFNKKNSINWLSKYKKTINPNTSSNIPCKICNKKKFRYQYIYFEELTFYIK